jgi:hypothetical protein
MQYRNLIRYVADCSQLRLLKCLWRYSRWKYTCQVLVIVAVLGCTVAWSTVWGQVPTSFLEITGVDVARFPEIAVTLYGEGLNGELGGSTMVLEEDGVPQILTKSESVLVGTQTILALDLSAAMLVDGSKTAVDQTIGQLANDNYLTTGRDWLGAIAYDQNDTTTTPQLVADWRQTDYDTTASQIIDHQPLAPQGVTPVDTLLQAAITYFEDTAVAPTNLTRSIVLFSDGVNPALVAAKAEIQRLAAENGSTGSHVVPVEIKMM